jgi:hemoglobin/transferrin/lactoferrin receptor protein
MPRSSPLAVPALLAAAVLPVALPLASAARAADVEMEPIVVSSTRSDVDLLTAPLSVTVVPSREIEERHAGATAAMTLVDVPGLSFSFGRMAPGNNLSVSIRGQNPTRVLYLVDGVRQNSVFKEDQNKAFLNIDPEDIERIEVIKGPASALYGSDAIGGVVNVITRSGGLGAPVGGRVGLTFDGSRSGFKPNAAIYGDTGGWSYRVSGTYLRTGDMRSVEAGRMDHSSYRSESAIAQLGYAFTDDVSVNLKFSHYDSDTEDAPFSYSWDDARFFYYPEDHPKTSELGLFPKNRRETVIGTLIMDNVSGFLERLTLTAHYQYRDAVQQGFYTSYSTVGPAGAQSSLLQDIIRTVGGSVQADLRLGSHFLNVGFDYERDALKNLSQNGYLAPLLATEATQTVMAVFAQDTWNVYGPLTVVGGLRGTWTETDLYRFEQDPSITEVMRSRNVVANLGLIFEASDRFTLRARFSQGFREPTLADWKTGTGGYRVANPSLAMEKSENLEFGARYMDGSIFLDATLFYDRIKNFMVSNYLGLAPSGFWISEMVNSGSFVARGLELSASWTIGDTGFTPYASLTLMDSKIHYPMYTTDTTGAPKKWGTAGLKWEREFDGGDCRLFADVAHRFSDGYALEFQRNPNSIQTSHPWIKAGAGSQTDLSVGVDLGMGGARRLKAVLAVNNLFGHKFEPSHYYYPDRHAVLTVSYQF